MLPARRRRLDFEAGSESRLNPGAALVERDAFAQTQIDTIETAAAPEHLLRSIDVHDGQVPAKCAAHAAGGHHAANGELPIALQGMKRDLAVDLKAVAPGKIARDHQRVRLGQKDERIVDDRVVSALEVVIAQAAVACHINTENQNVALASQAGFGQCLDDGHGSLDIRQRLNTFENRFLETEFAGRYLQLRLACNLIDGFVE